MKSTGKSKIIYSFVLFFISDILVGNLVSKYGPEAWDGFIIPVCLLIAGATFFYFEYNVYMILDNHYKQIKNFLKLNMILMIIGIPGYIVYFLFSKLFILIFH